MITTRIPENINIYITDLKRNTPALVKKDSEGFTILLNARYSHERLEQALMHELKHIEKDHFSLPTAAEAEIKAHELAQPSPRTIKSHKPGYLFYEALALRPYLEEIKEQLAKKRLLQEAIARREVNDWISSLERDQNKGARRGKQPSRTPYWVKDMRKKLGI